MNLYFLKFNFFIILIGFLFSSCRPTTTINDTNDSSSGTISITLTPAQKVRAESLISIWENSQIQKDYGYAENINDGRGVTWGWCGFTTSDGDAINVVKEFQELQGDNPLSPYISQINAMNITDESGFIKAVQDSDKGVYITNFEKAQNHQSDLKYYFPALKQVDALGLKLAVSIAELYDSEVVHGEDGVSTIISQTNTVVSGTPKSGVDEITWLKAYLDARYKILANDSTWKTSTDRVTIFKSQMLIPENMDLNNSIHINSPQYGIFTIP